MTFNYVVYTNFHVYYCTRYNILPYNRGLHLVNVYRAAGGFGPTDVVVSQPFAVEHRKVEFKGL